MVMVVVCCCLFGFLLLIFKSLFSNNKTDANSSGHTPRQSLIASFGCWVIFRALPALLKSTTNKYVDHDFVDFPGQVRASCCSVRLSHAQAGFSVRDGFPWGRSLFMQILDHSSGFFSGFWFPSHLFITSQKASPANK